MRHLRLVPTLAYDSSLPGPAGYANRVKTRYLLIVSMATALLILGASAVWFLMAVGR